MDVRIEASTQAVSIGSLTSHVPLLSGLGTAWRACPSQLAWPAAARGPGAETGACPNGTLLLQPPHPHPWSSCLREPWGFWAVLRCRFMSGTSLRGSVCLSSTCTDPRVPHRRRCAGLQPAAPGHPGLSLVSGGGCWPRHPCLLSSTPCCQPLQCPHAHPPHADPAAQGQLDPQDQACEWQALCPHCPVL